MAVESPPAFLQSGSYPAEQARRAIFSWAARTSANSPGIISGGLLSASDLQLSAPASGLSVLVSPGECLIGGSEAGAQGGAYARATSQSSLAISAANPTNPRIDTVCATMSDAQYTEPTGGSGNQWALQVVTGTATSGATLANLLGAATLPLSSLLLGYVLVRAGASSIVTADIANVAGLAQTGPQPQIGRGYEWAYAQITSPGTVSSTTESAGNGVLTASAFTPDGGPVLCEFFASYIQPASVAGAQIIVCLFEGSTEITRLGIATAAAATAEPASFVAKYRFTPTSSSHIYSVNAFQSGGTGTIGAGLGGTGNYSPTHVRFTKV